MASNSIAVAVAEACGFSPEDFHSKVSSLRKPCVLKGLDIGRAPTRWTPEYLCAKCGDKPVRVHVTPSSKMDFIGKNFAYRTLPFNEFVTRCSRSTQIDYFISPEEKYYLRALGNNPRKDVASFTVQYPELAEDFNPPLLFGSGDFFSSVLRISSPDVQLWTHYDVMDNMLVQVKGTKRVVLFSPKDALYLYLSGDKSAVLDIDQPDTDKYPLFQRALRYECILQPGDVLFIPALWFHNVLSMDFSVAVNIFWKHLDPEFYDSKDVYGNKDPPQVQRALQIMERALTAVDELPADYKDFYGRCMIVKIQQRYLLN